MKVQFTSLTELSFQPRSATAPQQMRSFQMQNCKISWQTICEFSHLLGKFRLENYSWQNVSWQNCTWQSVTWQNVTWQNVTLDKMLLLTKCYLTKCYLTKCNLTICYFDKMLLDNVCLTKCYWTPRNLDFLDFLSLVKKEYGVCQFGVYPFLFTAVVKIFHVEK